MGQHFRLKVVGGDLSINQGYIWTFHQVTHFQAHIVIFKDALLLFHFYLITLLLPPTVLGMEIVFYSINVVGRLKIINQNDIVQSLSLFFGYFTYGKGII